jgi:glycosyltransferase involved in cell wall biosynthesis
MPDHFHAAWQNHWIDVVSIFEIHMDHVLHSSFGARPHHLSPSKLTARVIFFAKNFGGPGISNIGLGVTNMNNVKVLMRDGYYAEIWSGQTAAEVDQQIAAAIAHSVATGTVLPSHVIINSPSWLTTKEFEGLATKYPNIVFVLQNHTGTAYLSIDRNNEESGILANKKVMALERLMANVRLSGNNARFVQWISRAYRCPCLLLPNLYDPESFVSPFPVNRPVTDTLRIGNFGAPRPWKNQLTAAEAGVQMARQLGLKLEFYINSRRGYEKQLCQSRIDLFVGEKDLKLIEVPWESWPQFRQTIAHMHILFQPSFDETFNVVTADGIAMGVPSVVSECIEWTPRSWWASTCDPSDLVKVGINLLHDTHAIEDARNLLKQYVKIGLENWRDFLGR